MNLLQIRMNQELEAPDLQATHQESPANNIRGLQSRGMVR